MSRLRLGYLLILSVASLGAAPQSDSGDAAFERDVLPILKSNCSGCHNAASHSGGVVLESRETVLAEVHSGDAAGSLLLEVLDPGASPRMPLGKPALATDDVAKIRRWVAGLKPETAKASQWWAFRKPVAEEPPLPRTQEWGRNEIDRFILSRLGKSGLAPSPAAAPPMLMRRLYFDLVGEPPAPEEASRFLSDAQPGAYERLVDRLLADPRFGERWGGHWLDLARYADTQGFEADRENYHMWRYRDYVIDSFNRDKPYDQFIREQLAGDEIDPQSPAARIATGFLRLAPRFQTTNAGELRQMTLDEVTGTDSSVFLALTVKCAQCHDHKYDPIPQKDFYRMEAFFVPLVMTAEKVEFTDPALKAKMSAAQAEAERRLEAAQQAFHAYQKQLLAKLAATGVKLPEAKSNEAADALEVSGDDGFIRAKTPQVAELERHIGRAIANGLVPNDQDQLFTLEEKKKYLELLSYVDGNMGGRDLGTIQREIRRYAPRAEVVEDAPNDPNRPSLPVTFVRLSGDFKRPGDWVQPGFPSALTGNSEPAPLPTDVFGNPRAWRTPLANWIASPDNPLTARVMVNRIWQHLFGDPIVGTPSNFGRNGALPSNQQLLDWLAVTFVKNRWSTKSMIRLIVLSETYRQTSLRNAPKEEAADPANHLLWRQNRKRLEGDMVRDSVLAASGRLNPEMGGPGVFPQLPPALRERMTIKNLPSWTPTDGPETRRRSIYIFRRRQLEFPFLSVLDAPVFQTSCERRAVSTTALQALTLMNDDLVNEEVKYFARRVEHGAGSDLAAKIDRAFEIALTRRPNPEELRRFLTYVNSENGHGLEGVCRILLNTNEFVYVD